MYQNIRRDRCKVSTDERLKAARSERDREIMRAACIITKPSLLAACLTTDRRRICSTPVHPYRAEQLGLFDGPETLMDFSKISEKTTVFQALTSHDSYGFLYILD